MFQAIVCKFHGPTNTRGARVTATASAGRVTIPWDYEKDRLTHLLAAHALCVKFGWTGRFVGGVLPDGRIVFTCDIGPTSERTYAFTVSK